MNICVCVCVLKKTVCCFFLSHFITMKFNRTEKSHDLGGSERSKLLINVKEANQNPGPCTDDQISVSPGTPTEVIHSFNFQKC